MSWYAVYTRPRWEKKVAQTLTERGIENYCPLNKVTRQWTDRKKVVLDPLFKGYVFVKPAEGKQWDVKKIDGILNYVYWNGKPATVKDSEIELIRKFLDEFENVEATEPFAGRGEKVVVKQGIMMNYKGLIMEVAGSKARVQLESMGIQLTATFDRKNLQRVL